VADEETKAPSKHRRPSHVLGGSSGREGLPTEEKTEANVCPRPDGATNPYEKGTASFAGRRREQETLRDQTGAS